MLSVVLMTLLVTAQNCGNATVDDCSVFMNKTTCVESYISNNDSQVCVFFFLTH